MTVPVATAGAELVQAEPLLVRTLPAVPGATETAATPPTVKLPLTAVLPLASRTMLLLAEDGCLTFTTVTVLIFISLRREDSDDYAASAASA